MFDGTNGIQGFKQVPWHQRLDYRNTPGTFVYDEANKTLYLNGTVQFAGALYIDASRQRLERRPGECAPMEAPRRGFLICRRL